MTKLIRFEHAGRARLGVDLGEYYVDATLALAGALRRDGVPEATRVAERELPPDALAFFDRGEIARRRLDEAVAFGSSVAVQEGLDAGILVATSEARLLVPIPNPRKIVCVARNFGRHAAEAGLQISEIPILFPRFAATLIADGDAIEVPPVSSEVDWEGELAVVIGRGGRFISQSDAFAHVGGYTVFNDVTVRDYQFRVTQYTAGKNFATSGPIGPSIALGDEAFDPENARIITSVNGALKQDGVTADFIFTIPQIIEHISEFIDLEPGDIIPMGTPAGVGFKREPPEFLRPGDVVEVAVDGLGTLRNPVVAGRR